MQLKRLIIVGFKSFADKTVLDFEGGITAIVGPNGCGKSNIIDAFRWVMGETSAKSIRGEKMMDFIFAGTEKRKPLNIAEVTLVFDNQDGSLPIAYDEVSITRRVFRSGESEYLINKNVVRLKDIESLFWDTGLGKNALCIFEQGKIDQVIAATPLERRSIFEEASGILRFKERRKEAFRRLELAEQNVLRAQDIHLMVAKQKDLLEKQAGDAALFKKKKGRFEEIEKALLYLKWKAASEKRETHARQCREFDSLINEKKSKIASIEESEKTKTVQLHDLEKKLYSLTEALFAAKSQKELKAQRLVNSKEQLKDLQIRKENIIKDLEELASKKLKVLQEFSKNKEELFIPEGTIEEDFKASQKKLNQEESELSSLKGRQKQIQQERLSLAQNEMRFKGQLQEMRLRLETSQERSTYIKVDQDRLQKHIQELSQLEIEKKKSFDSLSEEIDNRRLVLNKLDQDSQAFEKEIRLLQDQEKELQKSVNEKVAKRKALIGLKQDFEGFSHGSKQLLQLTKLVKPLYEIIKANKEFSMTMQHYSETLVVSSKNDLEVVLQLAKSKNVQGFSLFCQEETQNLQTHFFEKIKEVTENYYVDGNGVYFFPKGGERNTFLRENEIETLTSLIEKEQKILEEQSLRLKQVLNSKEESRVKKIELERNLRQLEMKLVEINFALQRLVQDREKATGELVRGQNELKKLENAVNEASKGILEWVEKESTLKKEADEKTKLFNAIEEEIQKSQENILKLIQDFKEKEIVYKKLLESKERYKRLHDVFEATNAAHREQEKKLALEKISSEAKSDECLKLIEQIEKEQVCVETQLKEKELQTKDLKKEVEQHVALLKQLHGQFKSEEKSLKEFEEKKHRIELLVAEENAFLNSLGEVEAVELTTSSEKLRAEHQELKEFLESMSDVNLGAIEEYEKQKREESFLKEQLEDLRRSKEEIVQIIKELDDESRRLFLETFTKIQENFKKNFALLFEGGEASLMPVENKDLLEAGIEITAKPPGKQMRSISLLSGGEKCLTALALLFALFEVKPAAFCLLDEVDAPLDEVNVDRFSRMLKAFSDKTQFIVITHNKRTMSIGDKLHGISMEEKGVSKLISLIFESKPKEVEVLC